MSVSARAILCPFPDAVGGIDRQIDGIEFDVGNGVDKGGGLRAWPPSDTVRFVAQPAAAFPVGLEFR